MVGSRGGDTTAAVGATNWPGCGPETQQLRSGVCRDRLAQMSQDTQSAQALPLADRQMGSSPLAARVDLAQPPPSHSLLQQLE